MPTVRPRRAAAAVLALAALGGAAATLPASAGAADPPKLIKAFRINSVTCVPSVGNTVRADVRLWMSVVNYHGWTDWAEYMEANARLEATGPGFKRGPWAKWKTPYLQQDKRHRYNIRLVTDNKDGMADWRLHVKLIWRRMGPVPNVTKHVYLRFDTSCAPVTGQLPGPGGALPSTGGG
jgi:hypothetical protein